MGPNALRFFHSLARKGLTKNRGSGITEIADRMAVESEAASMIQTLVDSGLPLERFDQFIRSEADVLKFLNIIKNAKPVSTSETASGVVLPFKQKRSFAEEIDAMKKSGDIVDVDDINISEKITDRDMFKNSFLNKPTIEGQMEKITGASNRIKEIQKEQADMYRPKTDAEIAAKYDKENKESIQRFKDKMKKDEPEDKADGGRIGFRVGKFVLDKVIANLLGNKKKVQQAVDDIFPTGDYKYDADMAADALVENNPAIFKNLLREDLSDEVSSEIYGAVLKPIMSNMAKMRELRNVTRPEKTLTAMKEGKGIDMSDPKIADEFGRFMKETDPKGYKKLEQTVELSNFDPKGRKKNATGGRAGFYTGGITDVEPSLDDIGHGSDAMMSRTRLMAPGNQATTSTGLNYLLAEDNDNMRIPFSTGKLAGGIDLAIAESKALEERIARQKRMTDKLNKMYDERAIKNAPEGVLMDPPFKPLDRNALKDKFDKGGVPPDLRFDDENYVIPYDDGTVYYKDTGEYYNDDGIQVPGPSEGAKIIPREMEAAEGGRIGFNGGGLTPGDYLKVKDMLDHYFDYRKGGGTMSKSSFANSFFRENNAEGGRIGFAGGGGGRRAFLKMLGLTGAGIAGLKTGMVGLGEGGAKKAITETVKQSAGSGYPPPYFFKLVEKIKFMGDDTLATKDKAIAKKYKDYTMEEDFAGNIEIIKKGDNVSEDVFMSLKVDEVPIKGKNKSTKVQEYEEYTARPDAEGKMKDIEQGVPDEVIDEAGDTTAMTLKKADGGRIGYVGGGLSKLGITGSSRKFLERVFGKQKLQNLIENDPELHRGLLEVAEMFRSKDKSGLVEYMQNFLPQMSKKELEAFVVGSGDTAGIEGQLIRLGSGRDYKNKLDMIEEANNIRKLKDFDVEDVSKNAEGGRIEMKGGGDALKALIRYYANKKGVKGSTFLKDINPKTLPEGIENILGPEQLKALQINQTDYVQSLLNIMKSDKNFLNNLTANTEEAIAQAPIGMKDFAKEITKSIKRDAMKGSRFDRFKVYDKIDIDDAIVDVEQMIKNRRIKESDGRALNSSGGLQTMLGE